MNHRRRALGHGMAALLSALGLLLAVQSALAENPISSNFAADPSPHVFAGRVYLYATNDQGNSGKYWDSTDWRLLTSRDLVSWIDQGPFLSVRIFTWARPDAKAWAPEAAYRDGRYFFFAPIGGDTIGVASSDRPDGGFVDARGSPLVDKARDANVGDEPIDPAVLIDDDGQAYMVFGSRRPKIVKLTRDMTHIDGPIADLTIDGFPAGDPTKTYGEAPFLHKYKGLYYFSFSSGWPGQILYATSRRPMGPYSYRGVVLDYRQISTNHSAIIPFRGKWYLFYHDKLAPGGGDFRRSLAVDRLTYGADGAINPVAPTRSGPSSVVPPAF